MKRLSIALILSALLKLSAFSQIGKPTVIEGKYCWDEKQVHAMIKDILRGDQCDSNLNNCQKIIMEQTSQITECDSNKANLRIALNKSDEKDSVSAVMLKKQKSETAKYKNIAVKEKVKTLGTSISLGGFSIVLIGVLINSEIKRRL